MVSNMGCTFADNYQKAGNEGLIPAFNMLGLTHRAVQFLLEQLPGVKAEVGKKGNANDTAGSTNAENKNIVVQSSVNESGCARTEGFKSRKEFDMFGWLTSKHRDPPAQVFM